MEKQKATRLPTTVTVDVPMSIDNMASFWRMSTNEPKTAAYLGFTTIGDFREFRFSSLVLETYMVWEENCKLRRQERVFEILRDVSDLATEFPRDLDRLIKLAEPSTSTNRRDQRAANSNKDYLYAGLLYYLAEQIDFEKSNAGTRTSKEVIQQQELTTKKFQSLNDAYSWPAFDPLSTPYPALGHFPEMGEIPLERYSRANALLKSLQAILAPTKWAAIKPEAFLEKTAILPQYIPTWMRQSGKVQPASTETSLAIPSLPSKTFILRMKDDEVTKFSKPLEQHTKSFITYSGRYLPDREVIVAKDPRVYPVGDMWRDTVRRQLGFAEIRVDFLSISVEPTDTSGHPVLIFDHITPRRCKPWVDILELLGSPEINSFVFNYVLRPVDDNDDEDEGYTYEYEGPPLALTEDIEVTVDNDIALKLIKDPLHSGFTPLTGKAAVDGESTEKLEPELTAAQEKIRELLDGSVAITPTTASPTCLFGNARHSDSKAYHDSYDVSTPEGLLKWQHWVLDKVCGLVPKPKTERSTKELSETVQKDLRKAESVAQIAALSIDPETVTSLQEYIRVQRAFSGSTNQPGPYVDLCRKVLHTRVVAKHGQTKTLDRSKCLLLPDCNVTFLDSQINGAIFMLQRSLGTIPIAPATSVIPGVREAIKELKSIRTRSGILADTTGLGKTNTALLFLSYLGLFVPTEPGAEPCYRPSLILVPSSLILQQWQDAIIDHYPHLRLIVAHGYQSPSARVKKQWVSGTAMREALASLKNWPLELRSMFDKSNKQAAETVLLSTYSTFAARSLTTTKVTKETGESVKEFKSKWSRVFRTVILDEGHMLRTYPTKSHAAVFELQAEIHWFLTATPTINNALDILGLLRIMWTAVSQDIAANSEAASWIERNANDSFRSFETVQSLPPDDIRRLISMDPKRLEVFLDVSTISKFYHYMEDLLCLRRSTGSTLQKNENGEFISLHSMMPHHQVKTVELTYQDEEAAEAQWIHRAHARDYMLAMENWMRSSFREKPSKEAIRKRKKHFPAITAPLRRLTMASASVLLDRFDRTLRKLGHSTLVKDMTRYRTIGVNAHHFIDIVKKEDDPPTKTGLEKLKFLTYGSPVLTYIFGETKKHVLPLTAKGPRRKLLITEDAVPSAWLWAECLKLVYVDAEVLHAGLNSDERLALVKRFNDPESSLLILIIMYRVSAQGVNLDSACSRVLIATPAINAPLEIQSWGRVLRVSQQQAVTITRLMVKNSHYQYRDAKQVDKSVIDLATRSFSPEVRNLLVELLNRANDEVVEAHQSLRGQEILRAAEGLSSRKRGPAIKYEDGEQDDSIYLSPTPKRHKDNGESDESEDLNDSMDLDDSDNEAEDEDEPAGSEESERDSDEDENDDDDASDNGDSDDVESPLLEYTTTKKLRAEYLKLTITEQEAYSQDEMNLRYLLSLSPTRMYSIKDLEQPHIMDRALRLLFRARFGISKQAMRISPHVEYDMLPRSVATAIKGRAGVEEMRLQSCMTALKATLADEPTTATTPREALEVVYRVRE